jgi:hypothetical protein
MAIALLKLDSCALSMTVVMNDTSMSYSSHHCHN